MSQVRYAATTRSGPGGIATLLACVVMFTLGASMWPPAVVHATNAPVFHITAPQQVPVGEPIRVTVTVDAETAISGYEAALSFDTGVAQFAGAANLPGDTPAVVGPLETTSGVAWGALTCAAQPCAAPSASIAQPDVQPDAHSLQTTLRLIADMPGQLEIAVGHVAVLDAAGTLVSGTLPQRSVVVQIGPADAPAIYAAPPVAPTLATQAKPALAASTDLGVEQQAGHIDGTEAALAWTAVREQGDPCALGTLSLDLDADGCITIADVQRASAYVQPSVAGDSSNGTQANAAEPQATAANTTFVVNTTGDGTDVRNGDGVCATHSNRCSLRAAITEANFTSGPNTINFNIAGTGVHLIQLAQALPSVKDTSGPTTINGYSQPGSAPNTDPSVSNARVTIQIAGAGPTVFGGITLTSPGNVVRGVALFNLRRSITLYGPNADNNVLLGNFIGTDANGSFSTNGYVSGAHGVTVQKGASNNRVGGTALADRNVVSGNGQHGVAMYDVGTNGNIVVNNLIGLAPRGDRRVPNGRNGVDINFGSSYNIIGGTGTNERNVVSGNNMEGIEVSHGTTTTQNQIIGNFVGTDPSGTRVSATTTNLYRGVHVEDGVNNNVVANNVIGGNTGGGISVEGVYSVNNHVHNNRIGVAPNGTAIPNGLYGVQATFGANGTTIGPNNTIAYNPVGVQINSDQSDRNTITQNMIFGNTRLGIDLAPQGPNDDDDDDDDDDGANQGINVPVLRNASATRVFGTACAGCRVELFIADRDAGAYGQGKQFVGAATAGTNGIFVVFIDTIAVSTTLTATTTDAAGNTSEFAQNIVLGSSQ